MLRSLKPYLLPWGPLPSAVWAPPSTRRVICTPRILPEESSAYTPKPCRQVCWQTGVPQVFWEPQEPDTLGWCQGWEGFLGTQFGSTAQSCPTLCNPMDCSMPGFPVLHHLPKFAQPHAHWVSDGNPRQRLQIRTVSWVFWRLFIGFNSSAQTFIEVLPCQTLPDSSVFHEVNFWGISFRCKGKKHLFPTVFCLGFRLNLIENGEDWRPEADLVENVIHGPWALLELFVN